MSDLRETLENWVQKYVWLLQERASKVPLEPLREIAAAARLVAPYDTERAERRFRHGDWCFHREDQLSTDQDCPVPSTCDGGWVLVIPEKRESS